MKLYKFLRLFWVPKCVKTIEMSEVFDTKGHFYLITTLNQNKAVNWQEYLGNDYKQAIKIVRGKKDSENEYVKSIHPNGIYSYRIVRFNEKLEPLPFNNLSEEFFRIDQCSKCGEWKSFKV